jgi:hypothetical protein
MPFERLWLTVSCNQPFTVRVNEESLGEHADPRLPLSLDLTSRAQTVNTLELVMAAEAREFRLGPIYLEVRRDVHLTDIVGETYWEGKTPRLHLTARRVGEPARPLSIIVRLDEQEVLYQELGSSEKIEVMTPSLEVRLWQPGQANYLHQLDCQLLDPACVLSQHSFQTGFRQVEPLGRGEYRVNDTPVQVNATPWDGPLDESASLTAADREGRPLVLANVVDALPYLWHHPSVIDLLSG